MSTCTGGCVRNVINLGNSIIGVSILAMPYCFQKCGILLSLLLILASGLLTRAACHLLLKAAIIARRRNFEFLAFHTFGSTGKLAVEVGIIGFLLGSCIAFFVVIGDLGPPLVADILLMKNHPHLRVELLLFLGFMVGLPLGLLRKVDSLTSFSAISVCFYLCLMLKIFSEAFPNLASDTLWPNLIWWRPEGIMSALPIFSMALSCQTQLFEIFDTLNEPSLKRMDTVVSGAVHMCTIVYSTVGLFGYVAFFNKGISGNILLCLPDTVLSKFVKFGFILTVVISFPLCLFPCRTSLHSLLYRPRNVNACEICWQGVAHQHDHTGNLIPDQRFRCLTTALVAITIGMSIMLPNIELVLGIVGSTIGATICFIMPALVFIRITTKNTNERLVAQLILSIGIFILVACTYATLRDANQPTTPPPSIVTTVAMKHASKQAIVATVAPNALQNSISQGRKEVLATLKPSISPIVVVENKLPVKEEVHIEEKRHEPPVPQEPDESKKNLIEPENAPIYNKPAETKPPEQENVLDPDALKKEDKEMEIQKERKAAEPPPKEPKKKDAVVERQDELLKKLEEQQEEQKKLIEEQKKLLEELRQHKESHDPKQEGQKEPPIVDKPLVKDNTKDLPIVDLQERIPKVVKEDANLQVQPKEQPPNVQQPQKQISQTDFKREPYQNLREGIVEQPKTFDTGKKQPENVRTVDRNIPDPKQKMPVKPLPQFLPTASPKYVVPPNPQSIIGGNGVVQKQPNPEIAVPPSRPPQQQVAAENIKIRGVPLPAASRQQQTAAANLVNNYITGNKGANISKNRESQAGVQDVQRDPLMVPVNKNEMRKLLQENIMNTDMHAVQNS